MKVLITLCLILLSIAFSCFAQQNVYSPTYSTKFLSQSGEILSVRSEGFGRNQNEAMLDAERYAVRTLLQNGYPGSQQSTPLISKDQQSKQAAFIEKFLENNEFKPFLTSTQAITDTQKVKGGKVKTKEGKAAPPKQKITADIQINLVALRRHLEENKVIRKFGY